MNEKHKPSSTVDESDPRLLDIAEDDGLAFACQLNGNGGGTALGWPEVEGWTQSDGPIWIHLNNASERARQWLRDESGLTPVTADAMLALENRPRVFHGKRGFVAILRGANTNPGADPEDMVALRMWCDGDRLITVRQRRLMTPRDILAQLLEHSHGPRSTPELFQTLISRLTDRLAGVVSGFDEQLDAIEEDVEGGNSNIQRRELGDLRRQAVIVRRYLSPQREAMNALMQDPPSWLDDRMLLNLREAADRLQRYLEDLDASRERAVVVKDEISNRLAEQMNRNMYVISIVAAIFLPLSFVTGLLGINVGGMPGVEDGRAFWITSGLLGFLLVGELAVFRKLKWF